ncbi:MAG: TlyA family RNA methyltransferase [Clostridia bacterium]|nr:TlyA family RNA methyltransferase [Clostridia bacterium]
MRLDKYLSEKYGSRAKAATAIKSGLVLVNGKICACSYEVKQTDKIEFLQAEESFVSAGGFKLSKALKDFGFNVAEKIFADVGASNGGFTDCLFQNGAQKVYCIDVGESQLDKSLLDKNVVVIDNFNARNLNKNLFSEKLDGVVIDVSFISLTYVLEAVSSLLDSGANIIALIKPQFECETRNVGKNGIVKDSDTHKRIIEKICNFAEGGKLAPKKLTNAPIIAGKNIEYLVLLEKGGTAENIKYLIKSVKL